MYYIISLKHTWPNDRYLTLWMPDNGGYCLSIEMAGVYENPIKGYHDSEENIPIPLDKASELITESYCKHTGKTERRILNTREVLFKLGYRRTLTGIEKLEEHKVLDSDGGSQKDKQEMADMVNTLLDRILSISDVDKSAELAYMQKLYHFLKVIDSYTPEQIVSKLPEL